MFRHDVATVAVNPIHNVSHIAMENIIFKSPLDRWCMAIPSHKFCSCSDDHRY